MDMDSNIFDYPVQKEMEFVAKMFTIVKVNEFKKPATFAACFILLLIY